MRTASASAVLLIAFAARAELQERIAPELGRVMQHPASPVRDQERLELLKRGLTQLVDEKLVETEASSLGLDVGEEEVQKLVDALAKQNNMDAAQFREAVTQPGIDFEIGRASC